MAVEETMQTKIIKAICLVLHDNDHFIQFHESEHLMISHETHEAHCTDFDGPLHNHLATTYGLNFDSVLNSSRYFHVVDGVILDIMHGKPASLIIIK